MPQILEPSLQGLISNVAHKTVDLSNIRLYLTCGLFSTVCFLGKFVSKIHQIKEDHLNSECDYQSGLERSMFVNTSRTI